MRASVVDLAYFKSRTTVNPTTGCWEWNGHRNLQGYGTVRAIRACGKGRKAHRLAYMTLVGPIHGDLCVCHRCDNPPCCNPEHLFLGTQQQNTRERDEKKRQWTPFGKIRQRRPMDREHAMRIRAMHERNNPHGGLATVDISRMFSLSKTTVRDIVSGRTFAQA